MKTLTELCKAIVSLSVLFAGFFCVAEEIHWGAETNGYRGGVEAFWSEKQLVVYVHAQQPDWEVRPPIDNYTFTNNRDKYLKPPYRVMLSTNWIPGPMKICDSKGHELPALNVAIIKPAFFPEILNWDWRKASAMRPYSIGTGMFPCDFALFGIDASEKQDRVAFFSLSDFFQISEPGEYQFTVWPIIYKQSKTNDDIYMRIDLPPVTIPIKWEGQQIK